jgi:cell division protein FtsN
MPKPPALPASAAAPKPAASAAAPAASAYVYFVQAGAFTSANDAEQQRARLAMQGFNAKVYERASADGKTVFRVRIGPFDEKAGADALLAQVQGAGLEAAVVRAQR